MKINESLLLNAMIEAPRYDFPISYVGRKSHRPGTIVGCGRCGKTRCTLYGSGDRKLCKECRKKEMKEK